MKTKEQKREAILASLRRFELDQAEEEVNAKRYVDQFDNDPAWPNREAVESNKKTLKYGCYTPVYFLRNHIKSAMEMKPIRDDGVDVKHSLRRGGYRTYHYSWLVYSDEDEATVDTLIKRLAEQGYIKLSKSGKAFHVVKDKFEQIVFNVVVDKNKSWNTVKKTYEELMNE